MAAPIFLIILFIALLVAAYRDIKVREVPDTLSYGLIVVGLLGGLAAALIANDLSVFLEHLYGFLFGLVLGLVMYYGRQWGGGDAKLIMGVGAVLGFSLSDLQLVEFVILMVVLGAAYGLVVTLWLAMVTHRKRFIPAFKEHLRSPSVHRLRITIVLIGVACLVALLFVPPDARIVIGFFLLGTYLLSYSWIFSKAVEQVIMVKAYPVSKLTEGDWLAQDAKAGKRTIVKKGGTGITLEEIAKLRRAKVKSVMVKEGIPFVPGFLLALIALLLIDALFGQLWIAKLLF